MIYHCHRYTIQESALELTFDVIELIQVHCVGVLPLEQTACIIYPCKSVLNEGKILQHKLHGVGQVSALAHDGYRNRLGIRTQPHWQAYSICSNWNKSISVPQPLLEKFCRRVEETILYGENTGVSGRLEDERRIVHWRFPRFWRLDECRMGEVTQGPSVF